jgi:phosphatidate cytidylyltransferase
VEASLKSRFGTALVGIPLLVLLIAWGEAWLFAAVLFALMVAALREFFLMAFPNRTSAQVTGILFGIALSILLFAPEFFAPESGLGLALVICFSIHLFTAGRVEDRLIRLAWTILGGFYLGLLLPHWVVLFRMPNGRTWVSFLLLVIMIGDTAAYFVGKRFGSTKLAPEISPRKTVEGAWGYVAGSLLAGSSGAGFLLPELAWFEVAMLSVCLSILGQVGDLFESWIKRVFAVKDSGTLLPGHGGLLDRLDSLIFPAVFMTTYLKVFHS